MRPFFSVIIPTYNRQSFLKIAINSVLNQTFDDYELLIVDDGSTDKTKQTISKIKAQRIRYIKQTHQGVSPARNKGLKHAKGKFITFLDSDDRITREKLEITYDYIKKYPRYKVFHTQEVWYRKGKLLPQKKYHEKPTEFVFEKAVKLCCIGMSTVTIKKDIFKRTGLFDKKLPAGEDYDFWLRVTSKLPVFLIPQYLTIKQGGHCDQLSKKYPAMDKFRIYALEKILKSKTLSKKLYNIAHNELKSKCEIYANGARKRGKLKEADYYLSLGQKLKENA